MASRQRSFFDQAPKTRPPHWHGARQVNKSGEMSLPQRPEAKPITASTQSKAKLQAFEFRDGARESHAAKHLSAEQDGGKENIEPLEESEKEEAAVNAMNPPPCPSSQRSATKDSRDCPQTPVGRLPLSQLLASGDDGSQGLNVTPVERVLWDNSPLDSMTANSTQRQKKRKRAHSSSPPSSSQKKAGGNFTIADMQALQEAFKTPKANIIDDLWSRYSVHAHHNRSPSPDKLPMPHTFHSSSPQTPGPNGPGRDNGGLRRAFSCIDWPTSVAKRRRLGYENLRNKSVTNGSGLDRPIASVENSKRSRVSLLLEKLHDGLAKPVHRQDTSSELSNSSPDPALPMPNKERPPRIQENTAELDQVVRGLSQANVADRNEPPKPSSAFANEGGSSEFGDDDLDIGMIEALTDNTGRTGLGILKGSNAIDSGNKPDQITHELAVSKSSTEARRLETTDFDEFDEDDGDDITAAEVEGVFAKYEAQIQSQSRTQNEENSKRQPVPGPAEVRVTTRPNPMTQVGKFANTQETPILVLSDDEDEYGGDSDFEQVVADFDKTGGRFAKHQTGMQDAVSFYSGPDPKFMTGLTNKSAARKPSILNRYIIKNIFEGEYQSDRSSQTLPEKVLHVQDEKTKLAKAIVLRQAWVDSPCSVGAVVQLVGDFDRYGHCIVDNSRNLLILHPDHLISSTVVGDSFTCVRKAVLEDRVKATSDANQSTIYGHMLHELFQEAMRVNRWDDVWMATAIKGVVARHLEELFEINLDQTVAIDHITGRATELQAWAEVFIAPKPKSNAIVKERNGAQSLVCINKLLEVEEKVWSPRYGLKGNIDATVQISVDERGTQRTLTVPFELKTGKHSNAAHKAQTSLYTLLLSDRYDIDIACGILYYMQTSEISTVRALRHELMPMILQRNLLAGYVRQRFELPPMLKNPYTCKKCYAKTTCFLYHKLTDDGTGETSGVGERFDEVVKHLNPKHQEFFAKWDTLLTKEEKDMVKIRRELWTMESSEREKAGRCFGGVVIEPGSYRKERDAPKINRFTYTFVKQVPCDPKFSFLESQITVGEPIVISDEKGHFALANGYVSLVRTQKIQVVIDRRLHNARTRESGFDAQDNQVFAGIMRVVSDEAGGGDVTVTPKQPEEPVVYRLDKDEFSNGMALIRNNLVKLMEKDVFGVQALRRLIVEGVAPTFAPPPPLPFPPTSDRAKAFSAGQAGLNVDQKAAIEMVMSAKDYALVLGMPGTGKTTTIAHIIRSLVAQGKNVLLTSYTHTAVDNILLKLRSDDIGIFRLGSIAKVHPEIRQFADLAGTPMKTLDDLKRCYSRQVVATTCLGINHPIFNQRVFDYCIVDEASQITLPVCLGPIRMAKKFILVGDHYQLPPLVQNKEALDGGLDISLFKMLSESHPQSVVNLEHQYRMCEDIMTLSNTLIYNGRLKCGTPAVATQSISIPDMSALKKHHHMPSSILSSAARMDRVCVGASNGTCWLRDLLEPSAKAVFVNTDTLGPASREVLENGSRIANPAEAALTSQLVESLLTTGVAPTEIGVITLYRSQLALIKQCLRHRPSIEMHTADRFQGRDKEVVVLSLVRSNEMQNVGDLLKDWRRVNVALTRARTKLLILGSKSTLMGNELLKDLVLLMEGRGWCYDLPSGALESHLFEEAWTQISTGMTSGAVAEEEMLAFAQKNAHSPLASKGKENVFGVKKPMKQARLDVKGLIGKRPVLRDIVNDNS